LLVFRHEPLSHVVDEINRYRRGRIIVVNDALGRRPVVASFRIDRMDEVVPRIERALNVRATTLPGGIVLLS
jgi:transmembrane sensor